MGTYIAELDTRLREMEAQHRKDRMHAFRERVRKAAREGKHRLITGWVGEGAAPPISVVLTGAGQHVVQPMKVAAAFAGEWGALWRPPPTEAWSFRTRKSGLPWTASWPASRGQTPPPPLPPH